MISKTVGPLARGFMTTYQVHQEYLQRVEQVGQGRINGLTARNLLEADGDVWLAACGRHGSTMQVPMKAVPNWRMGAALPLWTLYFPRSLRPIESGRRPNPQLEGSWGKHSS